jgi:hypothetical protein
MLEKVHTNVKTYTNMAKLCFMYLNVEITDTTFEVGVCKYIKDYK